MKNKFTASTLKSFDVVVIDVKHADLDLTKLKENAIIGYLNSKQ